MVAAVCVVATLGTSWYSWEIEAARAVIGAGEIDAWHAWASVDVVVALLASATAVLMVIGSRTERTRLFQASAVLAAGVVAGVLYMMIGGYSTPGLTPLETQTVTLEQGAWLALLAASVLLLTALYGALRAASWRRAIPLERSAVSMSVAALVSGLAFAGIALAHDPEHQQTFYSNGDAPAYEKCGQGIARTAHGIHNRGFARSNTYALTAEYVYPPRCARIQENRPNGTISTRFVYQVRKGGTWGGCDATNLQKNADGAGLVEIYRNYGQHPCGSNHYYRTHGFFGYLNGAQSQWYNGDFNSGDHWFG